MEDRSGKIGALMWSQVYNPLQSILLSALVAALPVIVLLGALGFFHLKAHIAALLGLAASLAIAIFEFGMPIQMSIMSAVYGAAYGLLTYRLDYPERDIPLPTNMQKVFKVCKTALPASRGSPFTASADRLCFRRIF